MTCDLATGQVTGQVAAPCAQDEDQVRPPLHHSADSVTEPVGGRPESRPESEGPNGAQTFLSAKRAKRSGDFPVPFMAGWFRAEGDITQARPPTLREIQAGIGV